MPGIYQFFDTKGDIIYIGKAKNLKARVTSYFNKLNYGNRKLVLLVNKVTDIKYIVVDTESDALLLENSLIKKYQPKYNVLLKDDKSFPWICIKNETFPRIFSTRNIVDDGSQYFGPYTSVVMVRTLLDLVKQLYPLRTCSYNLSIPNIKAHKYKVCLEYYIGNCRGPCEAYQSAEDYDVSIHNIKNILKGNIREVENYLKRLMIIYAKKYKFEEANVIKEKIEILKKYKGKSTIINPKIKSADVFSIIYDGSYAYVNFIKVVNGTIIQSHTLEIKKRLDESKEDLLLIAITEIRQKLSIKAKEIILPFPVDVEMGGIKIVVPAKGDKKSLLELSMRNAKYYKDEKLKHVRNNVESKSQNRILESVKRDLRLTSLPNHIECFDNSNIQGAFAVAACIVFKKGKPSKREYRHYNLKTVTGIDDFASMKEIVYRRYKRLMDENQNLPVLIVVDGGKGQLNAAVSSLKELDLYGKIAIIGIAKRLEELYFPEDTVPIYLDKQSETLKLIQQLRNEAHRFGISFHRDKRSAGFLHSELDLIKGIGEKSKQNLLRYFKSVDNIKQAEQKELEQIVGRAKTLKIKEYFLSLK